MTAAERVTVPVAIGAALLLLLSVWLMNRQHRALGNALRDAEATHLALTHQTVESELNRRQLQGSVTDLLAKNAELAAAVESAKAAAPSAQPVSASELQTEPEKIKVVQVAQAAGVAPAPPPGAAATPAAACALSPGEAAWFKVDLIELQTKEQNTLVAGTAELWAQGADLADRRVLGPSRFQSAVSSSAALAPPSQPRWGVEALGQCGAAGCGVGAGVLFPPLEVLGVRLEPRAGVVSGPAWAAQAALGLRF